MVDMTEALNYVGLIVVSAAMGFYTGTQLTHRPTSEGSNDVTAREDQKGVLLREELGGEETSVGQISIVPSPEQIWSSVQSDVASLITRSEANKGTLAVTRRQQQRQFSVAKLGMQALSLPARHQLILISLDELQRAILTVHPTDKSADTLQREVLEMMVESYRSAGRRWLGYEPDLPILTPRESSEDEDDLEMELRMDEERLHHGQWYLIREKIPIYTIIVKYLQLPTAAQSSAETAAVADPQSSERGSLQLPLASEAAPLQGQRAEGSAWRIRLDSGCLITSSVSIVEDMVLNVAELVALEYLQQLSCDQTRQLSTNGVSEGWPLAVHSSLRNTRTLERFRNQVFFGWWLHKNIASVVATFEDFHYLWGIQNGRLIRRKCFVRRSQLQGWRLGVSYFLEFLDAVEPLLKTLLHRFGKILSFFLVTLIGRSLGLILKGIQSSVQIPWGKPNKP